MIRAVKGEIEFLTTNHLQAVKEESSEGRKSRDDINGVKLEGIFNELDILNRRLFLRTKHRGPCMIIQGNTVTGTVLSAMEFQFFVCARSNVTPPPP